jgi:hypothetical protein
LERRGVDGPASGAEIFAGGRFSVEAIEPVWSSI